MIAIAPTTFVGRARELAQVNALLDGDARLVTLTGPGGAGKTRLAVEATSGRSDVIQVDASGLSASGLLMPTVTVAAGLQDDAGDEALVGALAGATLILDNLEQLPDAPAVLTELLVRCHDLRVLATSRSPLQVPGEQVLIVGALEHKEAEALFRDRAEAVRLGAGASSRIAELCALVDHLPLAIELAAARCDVLTPTAIAERLASMPDLLWSDDAGRPERHRSLRAVFDSSYELLADTEAFAFRRLAVFAGGASLEAACTVCEVEETQLLSRIRRLVATSLLRTIEAADGAPRYLILPSLRPHVLQRLRDAGEEEPARRRHSAFMARLAARAEAARGGARDEALLAELERERDELRAALGDRWSRDADAAVAMTADLAWFWQARGPAVEAEEHLRKAVESAAGSPAAHATVLSFLGRFAVRRGDVPAGRAYYEGALAIRREAGDRKAISASLYELAIWDEARSEALLEEALALDVERSDWRGAALDMVALARPILATDAERSRRLLDEALEYARRSRNAQAEVVCLQMLGSWSRTNDPPAARAWLERALHAARGVGDRHTVGMTLLNLADVSAPGTQRSLAEEAADLFAAIGDAVMQAWAMALQSRGALLTGDDEAARSLAERALIGSGDLPVQTGIALGVLAALATGDQESIRQLEARAGRTSSPELALGHFREVQSDAADPGEPSTLRFEDGLFLIRFGGLACSIRDHRGLRALAYLLARPGIPVAAPDLVAAWGGTPPGESGLGPVLDAEAREAYRHRMTELTAEIDEADGWNDPVRAERARDELDAVESELRKATGLGGRPRRAKEGSEKSRVNATLAIRTAVERIAGLNPALGEHLRSSIRTGAECCYEPLVTVTWDLGVTS